MSRVGIRQTVYVADVVRLLLGRMNYLYLIALATRQNATLSFATKLTMSRNKVAKCLNIKFTLPTMLYADTAWSSQKQRKRIEKPWFLYFNHNRNRTLDHYTKNKHLFYSTILRVSWIYSISDIQYNLVYLLNKIYTYTIFEPKIMIKCFIHTIHIHNTHMYV